MRYVLRKVALLIPVLFIVTLLTFLLIHLLPGNPCYSILKSNATPTNLAKCIHQYQLDRAIPIQYWHWLTQSFRGNLGVSYLNNEPVRTTIAQSLPVTLEIMVLSQIIALAVAVPLGVISGYRPGTRFDRTSTTSTFGLLSIPSYVLAVLFVYAFAVKFHFFPATGYTRLSDNVALNLKSLFLPSLTLALGSIAVYVRVLRADMIATLQEDFITMARAKGMPTWWILLRHAFRPSTFSLVTIAGLNIGTLIGGAFIVEYIFADPGIGFTTVNAILQNDYLVVQGCVLLVAVGFVAVNFLLDLIYPVLDPRVRHARATT